MEKSRTRDNPEAFDSAQAEIIWAAAARMQAEADVKLQGNSLVPSNSQDLSIVDSHSSFDLAELKDIADHAGINPDFVELAVLNAKLEEVSPSRQDQSLIERIVGLVDNGLVDCEAELDYSIEEVNAAIQRVFPSTQYGLQLVDVVGDGQPGDTILKFKAPPGSLSLGHITQIYVTLHPLSNDKCQINLRAEQHFSPAANGQLVLSLLVGLGICWWPIPAMLGDNSAAMISLVCLIVFLGGVGSMLWLNRWDNGSRTKRSKTSLEEILQAVRADAKTKGHYAGPKKDN